MDISWIKNLKFVFQPKALKVYRCSPSAKGTYDPITFYYHFHDHLCGCGVCKLTEPDRNYTTSYLTKYKRMRNGGIDDDVWNKYVSFDTKNKFCTG